MKIYKYDKDNKILQIKKLYAQNSKIISEQLKVLVDNINERIKQLDKIIVNDSGASYNEMSEHNYLVGIINEIDKVKELNKSNDELILKKL